MNFTCGQLVIVTAGKYKGLVMAIVALDGVRVHTADGRHRKKEQAKKFNPKHLLPLDITIEDIDSLTDKMLWKKIQLLSVETHMD